MDITSFLLAKKTPSLAIVGDICLDLYYQVSTDGGEVSAETGLQTYSVITTKTELGGACNVAVNCRTLGAKRVDIYGLVGTDGFGSMVLDMLQEGGIGTEGVVRQTEGWATHVYHKVYEKGSEHPRFDSGNFNVPSTGNISNLLFMLESRLDSYDAVLINEQVPQGLHSKVFQDMFNLLIEKHQEKVLWFADCRKLNDAYPSTIHKLNDKEGSSLFSRHTGKQASDHTSLITWLSNHWNKPVVMTLGEDGAVVHDGNAITALEGIHITGEIDIVGAGDAFFAGLAVASANGAILSDAAYVGNLCAAVALQKLYETGHPSRDEVLALAKDTNLRYNSNRAKDTRLASYWSDTPIEIVTIQKKRSVFPKVAIFDHDGTISTLREGWEAVMEEVMVSCIASDAYASLDSAELASLRETAKTFIDRTTGIQTIVQMHYLADLVVKSGYVKTGDVLSPKQYKAIYNEKLLEMVAHKVQLLQDGRLKAEDVTLKDVVPFLRLLHANGTKLYLASGTDVEDVKREAGLLGYADLFEGRIFGSVGDVKNDPKQLVIKGIIADIEASPTISVKDCVVFGDGPVEMREAKKHGLLAVGVLSDEVRRYGSNMAKRERLVLGGADLLIPDFSWGGELAQFLGWEEKA